MPLASANGIQIEYETLGDPADPALLLIMGLGAQLTLWPVELVEALVAKRFYVIRFDNRDIGLSTKFDSAGLPDMMAIGMAAMAGKPAPIPYTLTDMAADAVGLLDALGIAKAHVVGVSMGGMIAQLVAATWPGRVLSLTSIMSSTGNRALPPAQPNAIAVLNNRPLSAELPDALAYGVMAARTIGSPGYPASEERLRERIERDYRRSFYPVGAMRQMAAIIADGDRRERLKAITAPTLVIHGEDDPLVPLEGGRDTAASIAGAELRTIPGMGHDLPLELVDEIADAIAGVAGKAKVGG